MIWRKLKKVIIHLFCPDIWEVKTGINKLESHQVYF